jgi:hypothetical protein
MPVEDPDFSGDQARHDSFGTFYEFVLVLETQEKLPDDTIPNMHPA